jgi:hypothetical protein
VDSLYSAQVKGRESNEIEKLYELDLPIISSRRQIPRE